MENEEKKKKKTFALMKEKLKEVVNSIVEGDDFTLHAADEAITALSVLRDFKCSSASFSSKFDLLSFPVPVSVPPQFRCPISGHIMTDPVILANGQRWLNEVHKICPQTQHVLSHSILSPNYLVYDMISRWCKDQGIELPMPVGDIENGQVTEAHKYRLRLLLHKLSLSTLDQKEAAREIRMLANRMPSFRTLFGDSEVIQKLLIPLSPGVDCVDPELHEDLITSVLNLSINDNNKRVFAEDEKLMSFIIDSLKSGTIQTRSNAAAAIFSLSAVDINKHIIGKTGAIKYLVDLLEKGHPSTMKDAASAIFNLCIAQENKARTVREGAVQVILSKIIMDHVLVDEFLALLALLSSHSKAIQALGSHGAVPFFMDILRDSSVSDRSKENCVAILYIIFFNDKTKRKEIKNDEIVNGTLATLAQCGTSRAKRKACGILDRLKLSQSSKHTT
uniref:RING-type E3 ubiquitin transferase n=1 Tax=Cicer arietinum TaxID=3827 RepID=A0A1S3E3H1_CICAR|nr:U-box domain-containing protein 9-like isoform X2 [Cicer arietinum]